MHTLEKRLEKLERRVRSYQLTFIGIIIAAGFLIITAFGNKNAAPDLIQAKEFQVVNDQGRVLVSLRSDGNAGNINLYDGTGADFINLLSSAAGTGIIVTKNKKGDIACRLTHYNDDAGNDDGSGR
ncbi:MAG TPA: hypothetical protein VET23_11620, partial [Chitinophagaceae bacterium]|nr:hypothetical protein [Chitinophagaceae bacterium]